MGIRAPQNLKRSRWPVGAQRGQAWSQALGPRDVGYSIPEVFSLGEDRRKHGTSVDATTGVRG